MTFRPKDISFYLQTNQWIIIGLLFFLSVLISIQNISLGVNNFWGGQYTHYNNFLIFKNSFFHLVENKNLYEYYFTEYAGLYKYSPTFVCFLLFSRQHRSCYMELIKYFRFVLCSLFHKISRPVKKNNLSYVSYL